MQWKKAKKNERRKENWMSLRSENNAEKKMVEKKNKMIE